jgi:hypothetical protein
MPEPLNLSYYMEITKASNAVSAGTSDVNGTGFAMAGYENILFIAVLGDVTDTATLALKAQTCTDSGGTSAADITGATTSTFTADATSGDNKILVLDVIRPNGTFVRPVLDRGTANAVVECILAIRYGYKKPPVPQALSVATKVWGAA